MMNYTTVVFDLDGTLLNTLEDLMDAVNYALHEFGYPKRTLPEIRSFVGNGVRKLLERALPVQLDAPQFENVLSAFRTYYTAHCEDKTHAYAGIPELLGQLKTAGLKLAIVSNKIDSAVKSLHASYFQASVDVAIGEKDGVRKKPAPDMVEQALAELGSTKEHAVYVGDSDVDIQTAKNAGLACISVTWGFREKDFLLEHGARVTADTPQQVYECIMGPSVDR